MAMIVRRVAPSRARRRAASTMASMANVCASSFQAAILSWVKIDLSSSSSVLNILLFKHFRVIVLLWFFQQSSKLKMTMRFNEYT